MLYDEENLLPRVGQIKRNGKHANLRSTEKKEYIFRAIPHEQRDPVAGSQPKPIQAGRNAVGSLVDCSIGKLLIAVFEKNPPLKSACLSSKKIP
jgi:hypothetical protein